MELVDKFVVLEVFLVLDQKLPGYFVRIFSASMLLQRLELILIVLQSFLQHFDVVVH